MRHSFGFGFSPARPRRRGGDAVVIPPTQTVAFGAKTLRGHGGHALGYTGAGTLSITGGNSSGFWSIDSRNHLVLAGTYGSAPPALATGSAAYVLTVTDGTVTSTVTVNVVANEYSVRALNSGANADTATSFQLRTILNSGSAVNFGDVIRFRDGSILNDGAGGTVAPLDMRVRKASQFSQRAGGPAAPAAKGDPGWVTVTAETPWGATIRALGVENNTIQDHCLRFTGLVFERFNISGQTASALAPLNFLAANAGGTKWVRVDNCRFRSRLESGTVATTTNICSSVRFPLPTIVGDVDPAALSVNRYLYVEDNRFENVYDAISINGADIDIIGNRGFDVWNDFVKGTYCGANIDWNVVRNKKYGDGGLHGDFFQQIMDILAPGTYPGLRFRGNRMLRGVGRDGEADGQGIFLSSDTTAGVIFDDIIVENNVYVGTFVRGISLENARNFRIEHNTLLADLSAGAPIGVLPTIRLSGGTDGGVIRFNAVAGTVGAGDFLDPAQSSPLISPPAIASPNVVGLDTTGELAAAFNAPAYGAAMSVEDAELTAFAMKPGGPLDMAVSGAARHMGAIGTGYVDWTARTVSYPPLGAAPVNTVAPTIAGSAQVGQTLTSDPGTWTGTAPVTLAYQWRRDGSPISGATGTTYTLVSGDLGAVITLAITGTNAIGTGSAVSNGLGPVAPVADPPASLTGTRSIAFGPRNGDGFQNRLAGPQLSNLFGTGSAGAAGALAFRVRIQPGGLNSNSGALTQTLNFPILGTAGTTVSRGVHAGFGSFGSTNTGLRGRFYFLGRDQAGANYLGDRDAAGNPGATGTVRYLRSPQIAPNAQGSWTGLVILRREASGQFQTLLVTADGTVQLGDTFTPSAWLGSSLTSGALSLGSFTGASAAFGSWFPGDLCDLIQLDGAPGTDAEWQAVALGASPATVFAANLAAHFRLAGTGDLAQTAGSRSYAAFTLAQSDAVNRPIIDGPQLRPARNGAGAALLAAPQFPGYVHAVSPAGVRAAANRAAVKAHTGSVVRDVIVTGAATHVQGRALTPGGTQLVGWTRVTAAATTGLVETTLPGVPVGEVVLEYRREDDNAVISVVCDRERVGLVVCLIGQSQAQIAMGDETSVTLTPNLNTAVSYCWMRGGGTGWSPPDGGFLDRQKELSEGMTAAAQMLDALGTDIPVEFLCVAQQGTSITQMMYRYNGDGLDLCGDGVTPSSGMLTSMALAKRRRVTGWLFSWSTSDASTRNGGSLTIGATTYGARGPLTELSWIERMNEFFGGVEKSTADATERSERRNLHDLGFAAAWSPWVIMLPVSRHRTNIAGAAPADTTYGAFRQQQYDLAVTGAGKAGAWEIDLGAFQIDTFMGDGETAHQHRTDARGNIRFCLRYAQALAFAGKLSTLDPRPAFTGATRSGSVITLATDLRNGGSLVPQTDGAALEEFEVSEDGGVTWSRRDGAIPFTPAISGSTVTLTRGSGSWAANTRVRYLAGWPVAVGGTAGMAATEATRLNGLLYETRADAIPAGIAGLRAGVPLTPTWSPLLAA